MIRKYLPFQPNNLISPLSDEQTLKIIQNYCNFIIPEDQGTCLLIWGKNMKKEIYVETGTNLSTTTKDTSKQKLFEQFRVNSNSSQSENGMNDNNEEDKENLNPSQETQKSQRNLTKNYTDILLRNDANRSAAEHSIHNTYFSNSLSECLSITYLTPRTITFINGKTVRARLMMQKSHLRYKFTDCYRPKGLPELPITFGYLSDGDENRQGLMLYYRKRLIIPYLKSAAQRRHPNFVIGIIDLDKIFLPDHSKTGFQERPPLDASTNNRGKIANLTFTSAIKALFGKLKEFHDSTQHLIKIGKIREDRPNIDGSSTIPRKLTQGEKIRIPENEITDWIQCTICSCWREMPRLSKNKHKFDEMEDFQCNWLAGTECNDGTTKENWKEVPEDLKGIDVKQAKDRRQVLKEMKEKNPKSPQQKENASQALISEAAQTQRNAAEVNKKTQPVKPGETVTIDLSSDDEEESAKTPNKPGRNFMMKQEMLSQKSKTEADTPILNDPNDQNLIELGDLAASNSPKTPGTTSSQSRGRTSPRKSANRSQIQNISEETIDLTENRMHVKIKVENKYSTQLKEKDNQQQAIQVVESQNIRELPASNDNRPVVRETETVSRMTTTTFGNPAHSSTQNEVMINQALGDLNQSRIPTRIDTTMNDQTQLITKPSRDRPIRQIQANESDAQITVDFTAQSSPEVLMTEANQTSNARPINPVRPRSRMPDSTCTSVSTQNYMPETPKPTREKAVISELYMGQSEGRNGKFALDLENLSPTLSEEGQPLKNIQIKYEPNTDYIKLINIATNDSINLPIFNKFVKLYYYLSILKDQYEDLLRYNEKENDCFEFQKLGRKIVSWGFTNKNKECRPLIIIAFKKQYHQSYDVLKLNQFFGVDIDKHFVFKKPILYLSFIPPKDPAEFNAGPEAKIFRDLIESSERQVKTETGSNGKSHEEKKELYSGMFLPWSSLQVEKLISSTSPKFIEERLREWFLGRA